MSPRTKILLLTGIAAIAIVLAASLTADANLDSDQTEGGTSAPAPDPSSESLAAPVQPANADADTPGRRLVYDYAATLRMQVAQAEHQAPAMALELAGQLVLQDLAAEGENRIVEVAFPGTKLTAEQLAEAGEGLAASFRRPTRLRIDRQGNVSSIAFDPATPDDHKNWVRAVIAALHWTVEPGQTRWVRREADAAGSAEVTYEWAQAPMTLRKDKRAYDSRAGRAKPEVSGHGEATYDGEQACVREARYAERSRLVVADLGLDLRTELSATMRLQTIAFAGGRPRVAVQSDWEPMNGEETTDALASARIAASRARAVEGVTLSTLTAELAAYLALPSHERSGTTLSRCLQRMRSLFELRPETLVELQAAIEADRLTASVAETALATAAHAGTPEARILLRSLLGGSKQALAVQALFALQDPDADTVRAIAALIDPARDGAAPAASTLFVAGCLAGRADTADRALLLDRLARAEAPALARADLSVWFEALGNAQLPEVCQLVAKYRHSAEDAHRAGAMIALRGVLTDDATASLIHHATADAAASVRCQAAEFLAQRSDARALATVDRILFSGDDAEVQRTVMRVLAARIAEPPMLARVQQGTTHRDAEVQRLATAALARS